MFEVAIVGGGLIGLASALECRRRGLSVCVVDRGDETARASWAAAGILGPQSEAHGPSPMLELCRRSFAEYGNFVQNLPEVGYRRCGTLHLAFTEAEAQALDEQRRWQIGAGLRVEERGHETALLALFFPDEGQVDNRKLLIALHDSCLAAGVEIRNQEVSALGPGRVISKGAEIAAGAVVLCAGSWSGQLAPLPVRPQRGELLLTDARPPGSVIFGAGGYAVPRGERTLIGATADDAGFETTPTAQGRAFLEGVAAKLLSGGYAVVDHWAGLRPATPDSLPLLGRLPGGPIVATGHFRNGVLLTPITARIVAALVLGEPAPVDLAPFDPLRYSTAPLGRPT